MNKKSLLLISVFVLLLAILIVGCKKNTLKENDSVIYEALNKGGEKVSEDSKDKLIEEFENVANSDNEPFTLIQFIDENIEKATDEDAIAMILRLEDVQERYIKRYTDELFLGDNQVELLKLSGNELFFDESKIEEIKNADLKQLVDRIIKGKYKLINNEGAFYPIIDYEGLKVYNDYLPDEIRAYIDIKSLDSNEPAVLDGELNVSINEIGERLITIESYIKEYQDNLKFEEILRCYGNYLKLYLEGTDNTPIYNYEDNVIKEEVMSSYKNMSSLKNSVTANVMSKYIDIIEENQNVIDTNVLSRVPELYAEAIATLENRK